LDRLLECVLFVVGLAFGSFLNVCISRIPRDESIVSPPSHCPHCLAAIHWYDNLPLLSWIILRGRCRSCKQRISFRYPAVELLTAVLFVACYVTFGLTWIALKFCAFMFLSLGLIFMDAETGLLPREFTYPGTVLGLVLSCIGTTDYSGTTFLFHVFATGVPGPHMLSLIDACLGAVVGAGFFYLAWAVYYLVRKQHGLGFGDIALMGMAGAFLGLKLILLVIVTAPIAGVLYVALVMLREAFGAKSRESIAEEEPFLRREIPFGIFLGSSSIFAVFAGEAVWNWYLKLF
jgi:leader peptidase (prepilin peptidase)/N-methyltransferase